MRQKHICIAAVALGLTSQAWAEHVVFKIQALNPADHEQTCMITTYLPPEIETNQIISTDLLELAYDLVSDTYYVHTAIDLAPKEKRTFEVAMEDVWNIPPQRLHGLDRKAVEMSTALAFSTGRDHAIELERQVHDLLNEIRASQEANQVGRVRVLRHIQAYGTDVGRLISAEKRVLALQKMAAATGQDPGRPANSAAGSHVSDVSHEGSQTIVLPVHVRNSSTSAQKVSFRYDLPDEIAASDILDSDGLQPRVNFKTGRAFVCAAGLQLGPREALTFNIVVRDQWNAGNERLTRLKHDAEQLLDSASYQSLGDALTDLLAAMNALSPAIPGTTPPKEHIRFCRHRAVELDRIESQLEAIRQMTPPPGPTVETTWSVIGAILGLLVIVTIIVLIKAFSKDRAGELLATLQKEKEA